MSEIERETEMSKRLAKGRSKEAKDRMTEAAGKFVSDKSLQLRGMMEKKIKRIQGDYRDTTHDVKRRH